jgi:sulfur-oxidizing protein SoxA
MKSGAASIAAALGLLFASSVCTQSAPDKRRSGFDTMSARIQAMQRDDLQNPGMLGVADGEALWQRAAGSAPSCAHCHGNAKQNMKGVAARYPDWDPIDKRPVSLSQRINLCRTRHQRAAPLAPESAERLALEAYLAHLSRGLAIAPSTAPELVAPRERGRQHYERRVGQLNLSCALCHERLAGKSLAGSTIPEGHANGYPTYRLEWQALGSLQRRLRNCLSGVRAEPPAFDSLELVELELYLAQRSAGMAIETPAVRP